MRLAFVTVGESSRRTGGHLYNARVLDGLRERGVEVEEISACGESPEAQREAAPLLDERLAPEEFDMIVVDALARIVCAPHLDRWRERAPVLAMVHELPSVARSDENERPYEEPLLRADRLVCVSSHGSGILQSRGVSPSRIHVVEPGLDRSFARKPRAGADAPRVLCVAQWIPRKGVLELVEAWKLCAEGARL
ncbi:MAG: glycosyltransferase [Rubrobacter sp.]|nr:glycosyltransferase [Rubrobacter sp.]